MLKCKLIARRRLRATGDVSHNDSYRLRSIGSAFSAQQDVLLQTLTVRDTLRSAAGLWLLHHATREERQNDVEDHPQAGLRGVHRSKLGHIIQKLCSGHEKRRPSLIIQMLSTSSVLSCDQVTTDIHAAPAFQLIATPRLPR